MTTSEISIGLGESDTFIIVCRWEDSNECIHSERIIIDNDDGDLVVSHEKDVLVRIISGDNNKEDKS